MAEKQKERGKEQVVKDSSIVDEIEINEVLEDSELTELKIEMLREEIERLKAELQIINQRLGKSVLSESASVSQDLFTKTTKQVVEREAPLPEWVTLPWMFSKPENPKHLESWRSDWSDYTLKWAKALIIHLISVAEIMEKNPFDKLSEVALEIY